MKYQFGVMSQKFELESEDSILAKVAMCLFYKKNIPIAIYSPEEAAINPKEILEDNFVYVQERGDELIKVQDSIKEVEDKDGE